MSHGDEDTLRDLVQHRVFQRPVDPVQLAIDQARETGRVEGMTEQSVRLLEDAIRVSSARSEQRYGELVGWLRTVSIAALLLLGLIAGAHTWFVLRAMHHDSQGQHGP